MCHWNGCANEGCGAVNRDILNDCVQQFGDKWIALCPKAQQKRPLTCGTPKPPSLQSYSPDGKRVGPRMCEECRAKKERERSKGTSATYHAKKRAEKQSAAGEGNTQGTAVTLSESMGAISLSSTTAPSYSVPRPRPSGPEASGAKPRSSKAFDFRTILQEEDDPDREETRAERGRRYALEQQGRPSPSPSRSPSPAPKRRKGDKGQGKRKG